MFRLPLPRLAQALAVVFGLTALCGCGVDEPYGRRPGFDAAAQKELIDQGVGKYLGEFTPAKEYEQKDNVTTFEFASDPSRISPICMKGDPYRVSIRETGSPDLLIYLQGGGACWSALCSASTKAGLGIQPIGWTDGDTEQNPLGDYNVVFISYCDGSVFSGDNDFPDPKHGGPDGIRHHHGLANLSAGIDIALAHFPHPDKIVLAGSSAGGYGTLIGTAVTRLAYPRTRLYVINDAGLGLTNPDDPSIIAAAQKEWKYDQFVPASCTDCQKGQLTPLIDWELQHDPTLKVGAFSSYHDAVIGGAFLQMNSDAFKALLLEETTKIHDRFPSRFERFLVLGGGHTAVLGYYDYTVDGVSIPEWTERMIDDRPDWPDLLQTEDQ